MTLSRTEESKIVYPVQDSEAEKPQSCREARSRIAQIREYPLHGGSPVNTLTILTMLSPTGHEIWLYYLLTSRVKFNYWSKLSEVIALLNNCSQVSTRNAI